MELWDAYDAEGRKLGATLVRGEPIPDGVYHLACDILIRHVDGTYLLMRRAPEKVLGGKWEASAAGSALQGETALDCAMREVREETGVDCGTFTEVGRIRSDAYHVHFVEFLCLTDFPKDAIRLQDGETVAYRWMTKDELNALPPDVFITKRIRRFLPDWE